MNAKREISFHHVHGNALKYNRNCIKIDKCWLGWRNGRLFIAITNTIFHKQPGETINGKGNYISHLICNLFYINIEWRMKEATDHTAVNYHFRIIGHFYCLYRCVAVVRSMFNISGGKKFWTVLETDSIWMERNRI